MRDLKALPKAHLHLHLEGAMRQTTLLELGQHYGVPTRLDVDGSFEMFLQLYRAATDVLRSPADVARLVREVAEDAANDGAVWVEPAEWVTAEQAAQLGLADAEAVLEMVLDAGRRAERETGVGIGFILSVNRVRPPSEAVELARLGERYADRGVVAFGLANDEQRGPPEPFAEAFGIARAAGLISAPHGGEHAGAESVRGALDALGAQRVQHGVRAVEDPRLVERLAVENICLDVCPTSNLLLSVVSSYAEHQLPQLIKAGVQVSLNADDPLFFGSGILAEYELARHTFGLDDPALARIASTSIRASGAPESLKARALADINRWLSEDPG